MSLNSIRIWTLVEQSRLCKEDETLIRFLYSNEDKDMNTRLTNKTMRCLSALTAFLGFGLIADPAAADILLARENTNAQIRQGTADLDLNGQQPGNQPLATFTTSTEDQLVRIIFNAEGAIQSSPETDIEVVITVDPAGRNSPVKCGLSSLNDKFVSGNSTSVQLNRGVSAVVQCSITMPAPGVHTIRVQMTPSRAFGTSTASWRIDDLSLVIDDE
jgi:hypothetical protein